MVKSRLLCLTTARISRILLANGRRITKNLLIDAISNRLSLFIIYNKNSLKTITIWEELKTDKARYNQSQIFL